jgi:broad specificity phosphatase PhoE
LKPERIFIIRHGESEGNVDKKVYSEKPDYTLQLTTKGHEQAFEAGKAIINKVISSTRIVNRYPKFHIYGSNFWRTRQTFLGVRKGMESVMQSPLRHTYYEDPRLREQEWGQKLEDRSGYNETAERERDAYGHFHWRFEGGESCADVFDRVSDFMGTLFRDFEKSDYPSNTIIVTHGMTMRLFLMRWFHATVEEYESWSNPKNCEFLLLEKQRDEKYKLITPVRTHKIRHQYLFNWGEYEDAYGKRKLTNIIAPTEGH